MRTLTIRITESARHPVFYTSWSSSCLIYQKTPTLAKKRRAKKWRQVRLLTNCSSAPKPLREHRRRPNNRCRQRPANSSWFPLASPSKFNSPRRRRRHRASYRWSSTSSRGNRFGDIYCWPSTRTRYRGAPQVA